MWSHSHRFRGVRSGLPSLGSGATRPNRTGLNHQPQNSKAREVHASASSNPAATARSDKGKRRSALLSADRRLAPSLSSSLISDSWSQLSHTKRLSHDAMDDHPHARRRLNRRLDRPGQPPRRPIQHGNGLTRDRGQRLCRRSTDATCIGQNSVGTGPCPPTGKPHPPW